MTYIEIKQKQKQISKLKLKIEQLRIDAEGTTQKLSKTPSGREISDKVGVSATQIAHYEQMIANLKAEICVALSSLPDTIEGNCIILRVRQHYTWVKLACLAGGNNTVDSIKKKVYRYTW